MGIFKAITDSISGTFADQWKEIITASAFDEQTIVVPGMLKNENNGRGNNNQGSEDVISNGSKIFVPENTAAFIFSQSGIENVITDAGEFVYQDGEDSIFNGDGVKKSFVKQIGNRIGYGGISDTQKRIGYVNLREIRNITFGTRGPQMYHDHFYGCDLELFAYGTFSVRITDAEKVIRNFVPPNINYYSFADKEVRQQILSDFLQSFTVAINKLSENYRISQLPSQSNIIAGTITGEESNAGTWKERFGFEIVQVSIENIELSEQSRELINQFSSNRMGLKAYEDISQKASNISAQQKIAGGIQNNGLGDMGGMLFGMNMVEGMGTKAESKSQTPMSLDQQIESLKKLKELVDIGILSNEEFEMKKREIMNL